MAGEKPLDLEQLLEQARALPASERAAFAEDVRRRDPPLGSQLQAILWHAEGALPVSPAPATHDDGPTRPTRRPVPLHPERLAGHRILGCLGTGGMGAVYLARQVEPIRRLVALKVIRTPLPDPETLRRFESERQALALLDHANIARIYDAGTTPDGLAYFVMEHVPGLAIREWVEMPGVTLDERLRLFLEVCDAIQHAHQKGVIHRDLKPGNILVTRQDGRAHVKVIDFGIAKIAARDGAPTVALTQDGQVLGTPEYMSPEQLGRNRADVDTRTDVYSLGVVLYELLTGTRPHDRMALARAGLEEMFRVIREEDPPRPSERVRSDATTGRDRAHAPSLASGVDARTLSRRLAGDLDWIVMKALEKDRDRRYDSVSELAADLRRHLRDEPVAAGPPSRAYRARKFVRRHRGAVAATLLVVGALTAGGAAAGWQAARARSARMLAAEREREARGNAYGSALAASTAALDAGDVRSARRHLASAPAELRGWEWRHLHALLDDSSGVLLRSEAPALGLAVSPDGTRVFAGLADGSVRAWMSATRDPVWEVHVGRPVLDIAVVGHLLACARRGADIVLLDAGSGREAGVIAGGGGHALGLAPSRDGGVLAAAWDDGRARAWRIRDSHELLAVTPSTGTLTTVTILDAQGLLACVTTGGTVESWDLSTGRRRLSTRIGRETLAGVVALGDGTQLIVGSVDGALRRADAATGAVLQTIPLSRAIVRPGDVTGVGVVLSTSHDHNLRLVDTSEQMPPLVLRGHEDIILRGAFVHDDTLVTSSLDGTVRLWSSRPRGGRRVLGPHDDHVLAVGLDDTGASVVTGTRSGLVRTWVTSESKLVSTTRLDGGAVGSLVVGPGGEWTAVGLHDGSIRLLDASGHEVGALRGHASPVLALARTRDGRRLASGDYSGAIIAWDVAARRAIARMDGTGTWVRGLAFHPDGRRLASGAIDGTVRTWSVEDGREMRRLEATDLGVSAVAISPDGAILAAAGEDRLLHRWRFDDGAPLPAGVGHAAALSGVAFLDEGRRLATASVDGDVRIWGPERAIALADLRDHERPVRCLAVSGDLRQLATGGDDGVAIVRHATRGR